MIKTGAGETVGTRAQRLSVEEAAAFLGIGRNTAYSAVKSGEIPSLRIGGRVLVPRAALERLLGAGSLGAE